MSWYQIACFVVLVIGPGLSRAQELPGETQQIVEWIVAPYVGVGNNSPVSTQWGVTPDRDHLLLGVHLSTGVARVGPVSLRYAPSLMPLIIISNNPEWRSETRIIDGLTVSGLWETGHSPVYGMGLSPFGLEIELSASQSVKLYGSGAVGALWFSRNMPSPESRRFNYAFDFGGGLRARGGRALGLQIGYKFLHISNAYTARANPGVDGHIVYGGVFWTVGVPR